MVPTRVRVLGDGLVLHHTIDLVDVDLSSLRAMPPLVLAEAEQAPLIEIWIIAFGLAERLVRSK